MKNLDLGEDPLDPHGDGTIRRGDPMYELMMSGGGFVGNRREDGTWDVEPLDEGSAVRTSAGPGPYGGSSRPDRAPAVVIVALSVLVLAALVAAMIWL